jgi:hypothetical protein
MHKRLLTPHRVIFGLVCGLLPFAFIEYAGYNLNRSADHWDAGITNGTWVFGYHSRDYDGPPRPPQSDPDDNGSYWEDFSWSIAHILDICGRRLELSRARGLPFLRPLYMCGIGLFSPFRCFGSSRRKRLDGGGLGLRMSREEPLVPRLFVSAHARAKFFRRSRRTYRTYKFRHESGGGWPLVPKLHLGTP